MRFSGYFTFFILGALLSLPAFAQNGDVDLRQYMPPIRSQGDIGWCYANAAADLLSFRFRKELGGQGLSAIYAALSYNDSYQDNLTAEGGYMRQAIKATMTHGFCLQSDDNQVMEKGLKLSLKNKIAYLNNIKKLYDEGNVRAVIAELKKIKGAGSVIDRMSRADFFELLEKSTAEDFLMAFADRICREHTIPPYAHVKAVSLFRAGSFEKWISSMAHGAFPSIFSEENLLDTVDAQLEHGNVVGISYYSGFLKSIGAGDIGPHASVVVGRIWNEKQHQREYIIRNSWGSSCTYYKWPCEEGNVFVGEDLLSQYLYNVTYIPMKRN